MRYRDMMHVVDLSFRYPEASVLDKLSFSISAGVTLVQGGDGRGKTTLLRLLAGDLQPQSGQICHDAAPLPVFWVDPRSTAHDHVKANDYLDQQAEKWPKFDRQSLPPLIEGLSLTEFLDKPLYTLSTGSKRKVWLAAAFASHPDVALLDDPFAALDKPSIHFVTELLRGVATQRERAIVISGYEAPGSLPLAGLIDLGQ